MSDRTISTTASNLTPIAFVVTNGMWIALLIAVLISAHGEGLTQFWQFNVTIIGALAVSAGSAYQQWKTLRLLRVTRDEHSPSTIC